MPYNKELYKTTIESFGLKKPSKLLTDQARNIANGIKGDTRLIKMEIARCKLLERPTVTVKQQEKINKLTTDIDTYLSKPKSTSNRKPPVDPRLKTGVDTVKTEKSSSDEGEC